MDLDLIMIYIEVLQLLIKEGNNILLSGFFKYIKDKQQSLTLSFKHWTDGR